MKFKYLGTAAAEGYPAIFCNCERCRKSIELGGKNIRTRSQAIIDDQLLIDMPCDTYAHFMANKIDWTKIENCLITHVHEDHLYPDELSFLREGFSHPKENWVLNMIGSKDILPIVGKCVSENNKYFDTTIVEPFKPFKVGKYTITALKAWHGTEHPYIYIINDGKVNILYAHDTDVFLDETFEYLKNNEKHFDFVSMDCTNGATLNLPWRGHMTLERNIECRNRLLDLGLIDDSTKVILNHFSHNGENSLYDEFTEIAAKEGFTVSYDGMELEI